MTTEYTLFWSQVRDNERKYLIYWKIVILEFYTQRIFVSKIMAKQCHLTTGKTLQYKTIANLHYMNFFGMKENAL